MPPPRIPLASLLSRFRTLQTHTRAPLLRRSQLELTKGRVILNFAKGALVLHLIFAYIGVLSTTAGVSMTPTIPSHYIGTYPVIAISKWQRRGRNIKVGDIVSFAHPMIPSARGAKRVIGMPGDFVCVMTPGKTDAELEDYNVVGGEVKEEMFQVPQGHCWLAGDNLDWSRDGRIFGPIPLGLVKGKVVAIVWPPSAMSWIRNSLTDPSAEEAEWRTSR